MSEDYPGQHFFWRRNVNIEAAERYLKMQRFILWVYLACILFASGSGFLGGWYGGKHSADRWYAKRGANHAHSIVGMRFDGDCHVFPPLSDGVQYWWDNEFSVNQKQACVIYSNTPEDKARMNGGSAAECKAPQCTRLPDAHLSLNDNAGLTRMTFGGTEPVTWFTTGATEAFSGAFLDMQANGGGTLLQVDANGQLRVPAVKIVRRDGSELFKCPKGWRMDTRLSECSLYVPWFYTPFRPENVHK